jgi:hypothetical protein
MATYFGMRPSRGVRTFATRTSGAAVILLEQLAVIAARVVFTAGGREDHDGRIRAARQFDELLHHHPGLGASPVEHQMTGSDLVRDGHRRHQEGEKGEGGGQPPPQNRCREAHCSLRR